MVEDKDTEDKDTEPTAEMAIGEVARRAGLSTSAVRFYERRGLLPKPARSSGQRRYDEQVLRLLAMIEVGRDAGLTLAEIRTLLDGFADATAPSQEWCALAESKLGEIDALIRRARAMRRLLQEGLACECLRLEDQDEFFAACAEWAMQRAGVS